MFKSNIDIDVNILLNLSEITAPEASEKLNMLQKFLDSLNTSTVPKVSKDFIQTTRESKKQ